MTQSGLPFSGRSSVSRHCSYLAAKAAAVGRPRKTAQYREFLSGVDSATDHEASDALGWPLSSICSIRNGLLARGLVEPDGISEGPYRKKVTRWRLR
jgi:hypothetical protein